ncbi:outer membrane protein assembly factor BamB family protein [Tessaracoccus sp.]
MSEDRVSPRKKGPGGWVWLVAAFALVSVVVVGLYTLIFVLDNTAEFRSGWRQSHLAPAVPHGGDTAFLSPSYAKGARELGMVAETSASMVGASSDSSIVAVEVDSEVRGIDAATGTVVWTFPSYSCSLGSWDGIALCVDSADQFAASQDEAPEIVGLDLATGAPTFRFTVEEAPRVMAFVGADEDRAYFTMSTEVETGNSVLAITSSGAVAWAMPLDQSVLSAALVAENKIAFRLVSSLVVLDRQTGDPLVDQLVPDTTVELLWDGWMVYVPGDEKPNKVYDLTGTLVDEYQFVDGYVSGGMAVFEREALNGGKSTDRYVWAVNRDGKRVAAGTTGKVVDLELETIAAGQAVLRGLSADGSMLLTDQGMGTIIDATTGATIGGLAASEVPPGTSIVDGIVNYTWIRMVVVLLPGAGA